MDGRGRDAESAAALSSPPSTVTALVSKGATVQWLPLQRHPVFYGKRRGADHAVETDDIAEEHRGAKNLVAWDASSSRLYVWDLEGRRLHRLSVRFGDPNGPASAEAACPSEILVPGSQMNAIVHNISLNREGSSVLLAGSGGLWVVHIHEWISSNENTTVCRTVSVGAHTYLVQNNILRILQASWHPYSSTHLGVLSSDAVFRIYDLSYDLEQPEQEYFLQPVELGQCQNAASICPVAFSFGGEHLWDQFSVFILFSDGSVYILCPVVPFGSVFSLPSIKEIYEDAAEFGLKLSDPKAVSNYRLAVNWLEATFMELTDEGKERLKLPVSRAHSYAQIDASLSLQGPLRRVYHNEEVGDLETWGADCEGRAVAFMYDSVGKDSVLVIAWSSGQLQLHALADEVQPQWNVGSSPRLRMNSHGRILGVSMICEPNSHESPNMKFVQGVISNNMADTVCLGSPPLLLRLAVVDLALPNVALNHPLSLFNDPLVSERFYCLHGGGIDLIILHSLPFSNLIPTTDESARAPSVYPLLSACHSETSCPVVYGFVGIADSFGDSRVIVVTSSYECILLEMKGWKDILPHMVDLHPKPSGPEDVAIRDIISKDVLNGPKVVILPDSISLRSLSPDSIEGRSTLHHYLKLFHENYVEYAHKVFVELKQHGDHLKAILDEQHSRLEDISGLLRRFEEKEPKLKGRINRSVEAYRLLDERLQSFKNLPGTNRKPLSKAEREFRVQLERFRNVELGALRSSIEALNVRMRKCLHPSAGGTTMTQRQIQGRRSRSLDARISELKSSVEKLSLVNDESVNKIKLIEGALEDEEKNK